MGKTAGGAVWLDAARTSPYEFYQYWINIGDGDVERMMGYLTFLPMDEIRQLCAAEGAALREAKSRLAYEVTKLAHGEAEAEKAQATSRAAFGAPGDDLSGLPSTSMEIARLREGISLLDLFVQVGLTKSKGEARRLVEQGGAYLNGEAVSDVNFVVGEAHAQDSAVTLRSGKKKYHRVIFQ
jgi:tyrosyl-tRNA synthetase